uniref:phosphoribosylanthranilate isomerase n=1 Tax=Fulvivirga sp. TaxID=1931237 RepID=UPI004049D418
MLLKVCGMRDIDNIQDLIHLGVDYMGLIFYPKSPRYVHSNDSDAIRNLSGVTKVGVFVNETLEKVLELAEEYGLGMVQLHGDESPKFCIQVAGSGVKIMRVFSIGNEMPIAEILKYEGTCDYYLFDTKGTNRGGNGEKFDWAILDEYDLTTPFLLSGGIKLTDVESIKNIDHPSMVGIDINSGFEKEPGLKNIDDIKAFKEQLYGK